MGKAVQRILRFLAIRIIARYRPKIIGITGSIGKTGAKEAVYAVLQGKYRLRRSIKNYNNELGVPLTVIGASAPGRSVFGWLAVFFKAAKLILLENRDYPGLLILEMGVDHPGDMDYLAAIVRCDVGILTYIGTVHAENFPSRADLAREKRKLLAFLPSGGIAAVNYDNEDARLAAAGLEAKVISYGLDAGADLRAREIRHLCQSARAGENLYGVSFILAYEGREAAVVLPDALGVAAVYAALSAAAAGLAMGLDLSAIAAALKDYRTPAGRMKVIAGIKHSAIIDDSYNAEPESTRAALMTLGSVPLETGARKLAALGDMLELGAESAGLHRAIGRTAAEAGVSELVTVGERAREIARGAVEAGLDEGRIFSFSFSDEAGRFLQERIKAGDLLLVKGSQGARMEKITKELMAEPLRAGELLVRQEAEWSRRSCRRLPALG